MNDSAKNTLIGIGIIVVIWIICFALFFLRGS